MRVRRERDNLKGVVQLGKPFFVEDSMLRRSVSVANTRRSEAVTIARILSGRLRRNDSNRESRYRVDQQAPKCGLREQSAFGRRGHQGPKVAQRVLGINWWPLAVRRAP